tara:strand:- start:2585 stop:3226 length:642 start_codon:yes stop_codon:yes gene_type:complete
MKKKILILSPHTDDAELGAGGTILKYLEQKREIFWIVFSTAENSLPKNLPKDSLKNEFLSVTKNLNLNKSQYLIKNFEVRMLHSKRQEILEILIKVRNEFNPDLVIGPSLNDFHQDHIVVATEMVRAFKSSSSIISYELPWNHITFNTQLFEKLNYQHILSKIEILDHYKSQKIKKRNYFDKDFIFGLAKTRGIQINCEYAESFEVIRWINDI